MNDQQTIKLRATLALTDLVKETNVLLALGEVLEKESMWASVLSGGFKRSKEVAEGLAAITEKLKLLNFILGDL